MGIRNAVDRVHQREVRHNASVQFDLSKAFPLITKNVLVISTHVEITETFLFV